MWYIFTFTPYYICSNSNIINDKNCIIFNGPIIGDIEGKTYKYGDKCYKYSVNADKCDSTKRIVGVVEPDYNNNNNKLF